MGKLQHFDIIYNNPQEVYNVGDHVNGTVRMTLNEPMKMRCKFDFPFLYWFLLLTYFESV